MTTPQNIVVDQKYVHIHKVDMAQGKVVTRFWQSSIAVNCEGTVYINVGCKVYLTSELEMIATEHATEQTVKGLNHDTDIRTG